MGTLTAGRTSSFRPSFGVGPTMSAGGGGGGAGMANGYGGADPAVARMLTARARDPKWNMFGPNAYRDQYELTGHGKSVTDAINAGETVQPWAPSSGIGPVGGGDEDSVYQPTGRPASEIHGARTADEYYQKQAQRPPTSKIKPLGPFSYAHGTDVPVPPGMPLIAGDAQEDGKPNEELILPTPQGTHVIPLKDIPKMKGGTNPHYRGEDTRAPESRAGRTSGMSQYWNNQDNLNLERTARDFEDDVSGISQTPTQREMSELLATIHNPQDQQLMRQYFRAKQSGNTEYHQFMAEKVRQRKAEINALYNQEHRAQPHQQPHGAPWADAPVTGRTASMQAPSVMPPAAPTSAPAPPEGGLAPATLIPGLVGRTASITPRTMTNQYGTGSITNSPRTGPAQFNLTDTYDPKFGAKMTEGTGFHAVNDDNAPVMTQMSTPDTQLAPFEVARGNDTGFEAVEQPQRDVVQGELGRTKQLGDEARARAERARHMAEVDAQMSKGVFTPGASAANEDTESLGATGAVKKLLRQIPKIFPVGAFGGR